MKTSIKTPQRPYYSQNITIDELIVNRVAEAIQPLAEEIRRLKEITPNQKVNEGDDIMTMQDVCQELRKSKASIYRFIKDGRLKSYKKGASHYFKRSEIFNN